MNPYVKALIWVSFIVLIGIIALSGVLLFGPGASDDDIAAGAFMIVLLGLPALGLFLLLCVIGLLQAVFRSRPQPKLVGGPPEPAPSKKSGYPKLSWICFGIAALWTIIYGSASVFASLLDDGQDLLITLAIWAAVSIPAFWVHLRLRPTI